MQLKPKQFDYRFTFEGGETIEYRIDLDDDLACRAEIEADQIPDWVRLDYNQCPHCPLSTHERRDCPVARNLHFLTRDWHNRVSHEPVRVEVSSGSRATRSDTTVQRALSSLLGLLIGASDCPHTYFFRPMAYFHLPLASPDETFHRALSSYLTLQMIRRKTGYSTDDSLEGLSEIYANVHTINQYMARRLRDHTREDASINAVILLDILTTTIPVEFEEEFHSLERLYQHYNTANP